MKVTIACEKCGHILAEYRPTGDYFFGQHLDALPPCPNCAKLTYGPLTEDMMAEALQVARDSAPGCGLRELAAGPAAQARFVLRLLDQVHDIEKPYGTTPDDIHSWLLDLARQK